MQVLIESGIPLQQGMTLEAILKYFEQLKALKLDVNYQYHGTVELIKQNIDNRRNLKNMNWQAPQEPSAMPHNFHNTVAI
ncbi:MAG: hypothetical protein ABSG75_10635 [Syntrophales bacterium]|jgi:hypothetical protein